MGWFSKKQPEQPAQPGPVARVPGESDRDFFTRLAAAHLDASEAERWLALGRPAIQFVPGADDVLARIGGRPVVPAGFEWPVWEGHGPLSFIGEVDLAAVAASGLETALTLPRSGRLLAFFFDGSYDNFESTVGTWDRETLAGARFLYVAEERAACASMAAPERVEEFTEVLLGGKQILTFPNWEHPALEAEFRRPGQDRSSWMDEAIIADDFNEAVHESYTGPRHQLGGWASPVQGPVEWEVVQGEEEAPGRDDPGYAEEVARWRPLLQVDSDDDAGMMWGDVGVLYWLTRVAPDESGTLGRTGFTWQCS